MADPVVHLTNGLPDSGTGNITTLGQTLVDGANATHGITTGAAVITDAAGTFQQYLRGIVKLLAGTLTVAAHAVTNAGTFAVQVTSTVSTAVTNAGTFAVQAASTLNAETTKIIGNVGIKDGTSTLTLSPASSGAPAATVVAVPVTIRDVNPNGRAVPGSSAPVVLNSMTYKAVAASATATLFGATGASGDYLDGVLIIPATAAAGAVSITDGSGSAITIFAGGGTTALPTLAPFFVPIGAISSGGAGGWKVTTGTNVSVIGVGNFT